MPRTRINTSAQAPGAFAAMRDFDKTVSKGIDPHLYELVKLCASQINGCAYCVDLHFQDARRQGETERRLHAVAVWQESPFFTARERAAVALTEAVTLVADTHVPDPVWEQAEAQFSQAELAHLVMAIAAINSWNRIAVSSRMTPPRRT